jgi:hypothetical protein
LSEKVLHGRKTEFLRHRKENEMPRILKKKKKTEKGHQ